MGQRFDDRPCLTFYRVAKPKIGTVRVHLDIEVDDIEAGRCQVNRRDPGDGEY